MICLPFNGKYRGVTAPVVIVCFDVTCRSHCLLLSQLSAVNCRADAVKPSFTSFCFFLWVVTHNGYLRGYILKFESGWFYLDFSEAFKMLRPFSPRSGHFSELLQPSH